MGRFLDDSQDYSDVVAYFITFHTYGTWLHGDERGSVDDEHNRPGTDVVWPNVPRHKVSAQRMNQAAVTLNDAQRNIVEHTIFEVASRRGWTLHAINVRTNHVHVVVTANAKPEKVMSDFKAWSTRRMIEDGHFEKGRKAWVYHGSTKYLWNETSLEDACRYVIEGQGIDLRKTEPRA